MFKIKIALIAFLSFVLSSFANLDNTSEKTSEKINVIMAYPMSDIIKRCQKDFGYTDQDMVILEQELKRFLILSILLPNALGMYSKDVDNLWHAFILFTKEYAKFCNTCAGRFLHHVPNTKDQKTEAELNENRAGFRYFIENYERVFHEKAHDIWFLDSCRN